MMPARPASRVLVTMSTTRWRGVAQWKWSCDCGAPDFITGLGFGINGVYDLPAVHDAAAKHARRCPVLRHNRLVNAAADVVRKLLTAAVDDGCVRGDGYVAAYNTGLQTAAKTLRSALAQHPLIVAVNP